ncbi:MAG: hypothetical protein ABII22_02780 [Candidatus Micrarchaeota archaeon]
MLGLFKPSFKEQEPSEKTEERTTSKAPEFKELIKDAEYVKLENDFVKKGFTRRGIRELFRVTTALHTERKKSMRAAKDILLGLKGEDGLSKVLGALKLATEGLDSILKGRNRNK